MSILARRSYPANLVATAIPSLTPTNAGRNARIRNRTPDQADLLNSTLDLAVLLESRPAGILVGAIGLNRVRYRG